MDDVELDIERAVRDQFAETIEREITWAEDEILRRYEEIIEKEVDEHPWVEDARGWADVELRERYEIHIQGELDDVRDRLQEQYEPQIQAEIRARLEAYINGMTAPSEPAPPPP